MVSVVTMKSAVFQATRIGQLLLAALAALLGSSVSAGDDDHERAMRAMQAGEIRPLVDILATFTASQAGRVVEVELEQKHGHWIYEFKFLEQNGLLREIKVDARTGEILQSKHDD